MHSNLCLPLFICSAALLTPSSCCNSNGGKKRANNVWCMRDYTSKSHSTTASTTEQMDTQTSHTSNTYNAAQLLLVSTAHRTSQNKNCCYLVTNGYMTNYTLHILVYMRLDEQIQRASDSPTQKEVSHKTPR